MNKKLLSGALLTLLALAVPVSFTSCNDYDDEINSLNQRLDATDVTVAQLKALVENGCVIESVTNENGTLTLKLSNGKTYSLTTGKDGKDGKDAVVWTIGSDGYWYKDGVKTDYRAIGLDGATGKDGQNGKDGKDGQDGKDGKDGQNGQNGQNGQDGKDGCYYVPNPETGCFDIHYADGTVEKTNIAFTAAGLTATLNGNVLTIKGMPGIDGDVTILQGAQLGSLVFVPDVVSTKVPYATTTGEFYYIGRYLSELAKDNQSNGTFRAQTAWDKSNEVAFVYHINPKDAYIGDDSFVGFVNRSVTSRSANSKKNLLNVSTFDVDHTDGSLTVVSTVNARNLSTGNKEDVAAAQLWVGQDNVTSDYIHVEAAEIETVLANKKVTVIGSNAIEFYNREKCIPTAASETDAFIKQFAGTVEGTPANFTMKYDQSLDLKPLVGLYTNNLTNYLVNLGFTGISYTFSLPEKYIGADGQTNQQWFVALEDGVLSINKTNLTAPYTQSIGRKPVVRVDAFILDNEGTNRLVNSAYIKVEITENVVDTPPSQDKPDVVIEMDKSGNAKDFMYRELRDADHATNVFTMPWTDINNRIYANEGLDAVSFWNFYESTFSVGVKVVDNNGNAISYINDENLTAGEVHPLKHSDKGINMTVTMMNSYTLTSEIKMEIFNMIKTQHTYKNVDNRGAKYTMTVTLKSKNRKAHPNYVLTQDFYVLSQHYGYTYNPLYHFTPTTIKDFYPSFNERTLDNIIIVKGQLNGSGIWEMSSVVGEHFKGGNVFNLANAPANVTGIAFQWAGNYNDVTPTGVQTSNFTVDLTKPLTTPFLVRDMNYWEDLVNSERCEFSYSIVFVNPFVAGELGVNGVPANVSMFGNDVGEVTCDPWKLVVVNDRIKNQAVFKLMGASLGLTDLGKTVYHLEEPTVTYRFDTTEADYIDMVSNMSNGSKLEVSADGVVTWLNQGATLNRDHTLHVIATVKFANLSEVKCVIPVIITVRR